MHALYYWKKCYLYFPLHKAFYLGGASSLQYRHPSIQRAHGIVNEKYKQNCYTIHKI